MMRRTSLRWRITLGVVVYMLLLSLAVIYHGNVVNERAENTIWQSLLQSEIDHDLARRAQDPAYRRQDSGNVTIYDASRLSLPPRLARLSPGLHDDVHIDGRRHVALVRDDAGVRRVATMDITDLEARERHLTTVMAGSALGGLLLAGLLVAFGLRRLVSPLTRLASDIAALQPDRARQRVPLDAHASSELVVIADAINDYLKRNEQFVERERTFIDSASHELRTPVSVIIGASELALGQPDFGPLARAQMQRVHRTARGVEQLISLLLVLARDPVRLASTSDHVALEQLLPDIIDDHRHLTRDKDLVLVAGPLPPCTIVAPLSIVQAAIGNLLRNAIENSDRGEIRISLRPDGVVAIEDPGHGMSPEEISAIYARVSRGEVRGGNGIGLELIARVCEHLGWTMHLQPRDGRGTRATLDFGGSLAMGDGNR
jgi:signal transduction histidine kinase